MHTTQHNTYAQSRTLCLSPPPPGTHSVFPSRGLPPTGLTRTHSDTQGLPSARKAWESCAVDEQLSCGNPPLLGANRYCGGRAMQPAFLSTLLSPLSPRVLTHAMPAPTSCGQPCHACTRLAAEWDTALDSQLSPGIMPATRPLTMPAICARCGRQACSGRQTPSLTGL